MVHGMLSAEFGALSVSDLRVRGRITRVRSVTETIDTTDPDQRNWRPTREKRVLRDVGKASDASRPEPVSEGSSSGPDLDFSAGFAMASMREAGGGRAPGIRCGAAARPVRCRGSEQTSGAEGGE